MAVRPILIAGEPVLHQVAQRVDRFDATLTRLVDDMFDTMDAANGVGLAAPQIGVPWRVFTYHMPNEDGVPARGVVVNPLLLLSKVPEEQPDPDQESEGCLSVPGQHFPLKRAERAKVAGYDLKGRRIEFSTTGWLARCMQHEFDHLNGKLYLDRLVSRWARRARKVVRMSGWGVPGLTWLPGVDRDPFGHGERSGADHDSEHPAASRDHASTTTEAGSRDAERPGSRVGGVANASG